MANPFRQQSRFRKLVYFGLIVALFTGSLLYRRLVIEPEADSLRLREVTQGRAELTGSAVRYLLVGSRGLATTGLWWMADDKKRKRQWNELELVVRSITTLQPHFTYTWRFLGWTLAFNVSVECDRARDKYFYVSRGLQLLAEGDRANDPRAGQAGRDLRLPGNPDLRYDLGFFYQLKINTSDEKHYMRCLLDLSCIDPVERDPNRFWGVSTRGRRVVKEDELEKFCRKYPRLVRRLHDHMRRTTPEEVVHFLEDNQDVASRFEAPTPGAKTTALLNPRDQFPVLPTPDRLPASFPDSRQREFLSAFDANVAAGSWYTYAQEPLPPPDPDDAVRDRRFDAVRYRLPKLALILFRGYPARAAFHHAEALEDEGWFDDRDGWALPRRWFRGAGTAPDPVGTEAKYHAEPAWDRAYEAYLDYGQKNGLYFTPRQARELEREAAPYWKKYSVRGGERGGGLKPEDRTKLAAGYEAHLRIAWATYHRSITNFNGFLDQAAVDRTPEAVEVRKVFFRARDLARKGRRAEPLRLFEEALGRWEQVLLANPRFRRVGNIQLETYERQAAYLRLREQERADRMGPVVLAVLQFGMPRPGIPPVAGLPLVDQNVVRGTQAGPAALAVLQVGTAAAPLSPALGLLPLRRGGKGRPAYDPTLARVLTPELSYGAALTNTVVPLRHVLGRLDMLYVVETPDVDSTRELDLESILVAVARPVPLGVGPYQKAHTLAAFSWQDVPPPPPGTAFGWRPLLNDASVEDLRRQRGRGQQVAAPPAQVPVPPR
jgi:hypothetical protein